jgi:hypothetical protein
MNLKGDCFGGGWWKVRVINMIKACMEIPQRNPFVELIYANR